ncbi:hypothetical protein, partial [Streptomyces sp. wa22]|uniref:hypothetical protein n=1 Tax=Streptomyces sp. wa22 TaxID=1828244 RepID=UPI001C9CEE35
VPPTHTKTVAVVVPPTHTKTVAVVPRLQKEASGPCHNRAVQPHPAPVTSPTTRPAPNIGDLESSEQIFDLLMGNEVAPRKEFITSSAATLDRSRIDV